MATVRDDAHWAAYNARQQARAPRLLCQEVLAAAGDGAGRSARCGDPRIRPDIALLWLSMGYWAAS